MNRPVRLAKEDNSHSFSFKILGRIEKWAFKYAHIILPLFIILGLLLFVVLCYWICGVSATESGVQYNQLERII